MNGDFDIQFDSVYFAYQKPWILEDVNFEICKGEFASIVGPNGGGKTTMLKLILGLIKPDKGNIKVLGQSPARARNRIGYMPQYAHLDINFPATVLDVVLMGRLTPGCIWFSRQDRRAAIQALEKVDMIASAASGFNQLSGGQRQRILIARALCSDPAILLLDEPTANMDNQTEENLFELLTQLNPKMTILLVSHDLGFVSKYVRSVICVNRQVIIHPTTLIEGVMIKDIYHGDLKMVRHDHRCTQAGHFYD